MYRYYLNYYRHYLQHRMSAFDGAASLFDFAGALAPRAVHASSPGKADAEVIAADWEAVGDALRTALGIVEREQANKA